MIDSGMSAGVSQTGAHY